MLLSRARLDRSTSSFHIVTRSTYEVACFLLFPVSGCLFGGGRSSVHSHPCLCWGARHSQTNNVLRVTFQYRTNRGGYFLPTSKARRSAGGRGVEPALILQDLMHGRLAGSRGDGVQGELEQRAGEGPVRCDSDDAAPARHIDCVRTAACARAGRARAANATRWHYGERDRSG